MFTHHGTFIIGFSVATKHFTVAPEMRTFEHFFAPDQSPKAQTRQKLSNFNLAKTSHMTYSARSSLTR